MASLNGWVGNPQSGSNSTEAEAEAEGFWVMIEACLDELRIEVLRL